MKPLALLQALIATNTAVAGVVGANKPDAVSSTLCGDVVPATVTLTLIQNQTQSEVVTETQVTTTTAQPGTVTVALQGPEAISSSLSSAFSVESQQLEINSQLAPNNPFRSNHPPTTTSATHLTRTLVLPVIEATKTSAASGQPSATDVYFIGESNGTTTWLTNFTPQESVTIGTTTVTLAPVPSASASGTGGSTTTERATRTNRVTTTVSRSDSLSTMIGEISTSLGHQGWNTSTPIAAPDTTLGRSSDGCVSDPPSSFQVVTIRRSSTIATTTVHISTSPTSLALPTNAYGSTVNITFPIASYGPQKRSKQEYSRRHAGCELITATMRGTPVSWLNNWDGSHTVDCATVGTFTLPPQPTAAPAPVTVTVTAERSSTMTEVTEATETLMSSSSTAAQTVVPASSASTNAPPAATTSCGVSGDFTLDFDTLPHFFAPNNDTAPFPPIFNPYRHLFFSSGWAYVPPPTAPVVPQNGSHLAIFVPTASETNNSVSQSANAGDVPPGSFGAGPRAYDDTYWFNAETLYVFCDNGATDLAVTCDIVATGYQWDNGTQSETAVATQHFPQPPCPGFDDCQTNEIFLDSQFRGLSSLSLYATVNGQQKIFFMDTVELAWWNNTCEAGLRRASQI